MSNKKKIRRQSRQVSLNDQMTDLIPETSYIGRERHRKAQYDCHIVSDCIYYRTKIERISRLFCQGIEMEIHEDAPARWYNKTRCKHRVIHIKTIDKELVTTKRLTRKFIFKKLTNWNFEKKTQNCQIKPETKKRWDDSGNAELYQD